jgi:hypothetical protein
VSRRSALIRLSWAYVRHGLRRRFRAPPAAGAEQVLATYGEDHLLPLTPTERGHLPAMSRCINCGLCAIVVRRVGGVRPPDLPNAYLRDPTLLSAARTDLAGPSPAPRVLAAASAACPVGVPLAEVAAAVQRLAAEQEDRNPAGQKGAAPPPV